MQKLDVKFLKADILNLKGSKSSPFSIIVSNPPYIPPSEKEFMQENVLLYEPKEALFVPEENPLLFYKAISHFALKNNGPVILYFEINETKAHDLSAMLINMGLKNIVIKKDINGRERMIKCSSQ